jgi:hypothetical protein
MRVRTDSHNVQYAYVSPPARLLGVAGVLDPVDEYVALLHPEFLHGVVLSGLAAGQEEQASGRKENPMNHMAT